MIELATRNGAKVMKKAKDFDDSNKKFRVILFDEKLDKISAKNANFMLESARIHSVSLSWFLDSLACFKIIDFNGYALYDCGQSQFTANRQNLSFAIDQLTNFILNFFVQIFIQSLFVRYRFDLFFRKNFFLFQRKILFFYKI